jgi:hypothetical protein
VIGACPLSNFALVACLWSGVGAQLERECDTFPLRDHAADSDSDSDSGLYKLGRLNGALALFRSLTRDRDELQVWRCGALPGEALSQRCVVLALQ